MKKENKRYQDFKINEQANLVKGLKKDIYHNNSLQKIHDSLKILNPLFYHHTGTITPFYYLHKLDEDNLRKELKGIRVKSSQEVESNKLVAEFMGMKVKAYKENSSYDKEFDSYNKCEKWIKESNCMGYQAQLGWDNISGNYHNEWNYLMPVVDKIRRELYVIIVKYNHNGVSVKVKQNYDESEIVASGFTSDLDPMKAYYQAVVEFVKFFNNKNK